MNVGLPFQLGTGYEVNCHSVCNLEFRVTTYILIGFTEK